MKYVLATLSGMAVTLCAFVGGIAVAVAYLSADPIPVQKPSSAPAVTFTATPKKVNAAEQNYHRIPSRLPADTLSESQVAELVRQGEVDDVQPIDAMTTTSISDRKAPEATLSNEHVAWCSQRYRSYRKEDNSYTSYSGRSRECVSPYSDTIAHADEGPSYLEASVVGSPGKMSHHDGAAAGGVDSDHIASCFARYNSYRVEDNTYQPYGGGPRRLCD